MSQEKRVICSRYCPHQVEFILYSDYSTNDAECSVICQCSAEHTCDMHGWALGSLGGQFICHESEAMANDECFCRGFVASQESLELLKAAAVVEILASPDDPPESATVASPTPPEPPKEPNS